MKAVIGYACNCFFFIFFQFDIFLLRLTLFVHYPLPSLFFMPHILFFRKGKHVLQLILLDIIKEKRYDPCKYL
ncbi:MAG: hypothetical protein D3905_00110 [Candidatus Electrothrix sp. AS4_5]|nr:hypothetical protein [Candidatus Electrothrix gigas]